MRDLVLLQSLGGDDFSLISNQLVECDDAEADRLVEAGYARELTEDEPTSIQLKTKFSFVKRNARSEQRDAEGDPAPQAATKGTRRARPKA